MLVVEWTMQIMWIVVYFGYNWHSVQSSKILMVTLAGTKSHKIPFSELGAELTIRGHNVTFISAFPNGHTANNYIHVEEINPSNLVAYVKNFTDWDLLGRKMQGKMPVNPIDIFKYGYQVCEAFLSDDETKDLLLRRNFDLLILDGAYPECALGLVYHYKSPFIYLNTVAFYTGSLSLAGNPTPYSVTPYLEFSYTDRMNLLQRFVNSIFHTTLAVVHSIMVRHFLQRILQQYVHRNIPSAYDLSKNVSLILQNGHFSMTYPRPYLPGVIEVACIHCRSPRILPTHLEEFINGGQGNGFVYVAMGSSVKEANMPKDLRVLFLQVFALLPYQILWKWEAAGITRLSELPENVMLGQWFPQQDLLGHPKIKAFVTHGGLLSLFETVYHEVPIVAIPVFCDHDANVEKAVRDGYAIRLYLTELTPSKLFRSIIDIVDDPKYKRNARIRSMLLRDQLESPLERAVYWTEYVLRYKGAYHLQSPAKDLSFVNYYLIDVSILTLIVLYVFYFVLRNFYILISKKVFRRRYYIKLKIN